MNEKVHGWVTNDICTHDKGKAFSILGYSKKRGLLVKMFYNGSFEEYELRWVFLSPDGATFLGEIKKSLSTPTKNKASQEEVTK